MELWKENLVVKPCSLPWQYFSIDKTAIVRVTIPVVRMLIMVKGDILPDESSSHPRDRMSSKAVLAHEYYGHKYFDDLYGKRNPRIGAWNDEFRASYNAAINAPNLGEMDRMYLMADALERAKEAGVKIKMTAIIKRILYGY